MLQERTCKKQGDTMVSMKHSSLNEAMGDLRKFIKHAESVGELETSENLKSYMARMPTSKSARCLCRLDNPPSALP